MAHIDTPTERAPVARPLAPAWYLFVGIVSFYSGYLPWQGLPYSHLFDLVSAGRYALGGAVVSYLLALLRTRLPHLPLVRRWWRLMHALAFAVELTLLVALSVLLSRTAGQGWWWRGIILPLSLVPTLLLDYGLLWLRDRFVKPVIRVGLLVITCTLGPSLLSQSMSRWLLPHDPTLLTIQGPLIWGSAGAIRFSPVPKRSTDCPDETTAIPAALRDSPLQTVDGADRPNLQDNCDTWVLFGKDQQGSGIAVWVQRLEFRQPDPWTVLGWAPLSTGQRLQTALERTGVSREQVRYAVPYGPFDPHWEITEDRGARFRVDWSTGTVTRLDLCELRIKPIIQAYLPDEDVMQTPCTLVPGHSDLWQFWVDIRLKPGGLLGWVQGERLIKLIHTKDGPPLAPIHRQIEAMGYRPFENYRPDDHGSSGGANIVGPDPIAFVIPAWDPKTWRRVEIQVDWSTGKITPHLAGE